jgi:hypothetical protein
MFTVNVNLHMEANTFAPPLSVIVRASRIGRGMSCDIIDSCTCRDKLATLNFIGRFQQHARRFGVHVYSECEAFIIEARALSLHTYCTSIQLERRVRVSVSRQVFHM